MQLLNAVGFRSIIDYISNSRKLILGHNMLLDLLHTYGRFVKPLPNTLSEFKTNIHSTFPNILDTKYFISNCPPILNIFTHTGLEEAYQKTKAELYNYPNIVFAKEFNRYSNENNKNHEAGYDAYITGCLFIRLANFFAKISQIPEDQLPITTSHPILAKFINKIHVVRYDSYINLVGLDEVVDRSNILHLSGFAATSTTEQLMQHLKKWSPIKFEWIDDTSTYIAVKDAATAAEIIVAFAGKTTPFRVLDYYTSIVAFTDHDKDSYQNKKRIASGTIKNDNSNEMKTKKSEDLPPDTLEDNMNLKKNEK